MVRSSRHVDNLGDIRGAAMVARQWLANHVVVEAPCARKALQPVSAGRPHPRVFPPSSLPPASFSTQRAEVVQAAHVSRRFRAEGAPDQSRRGG